MLSLDRCRSLLGPAGTQISDSNLEILRDQLYALADIACEAAARDTVSDADFQNVTARLPDDIRDAADERAAIIQHDGGLPRQIAERRALHAASRGSGPVIDLATEE